jgi:MFS family permease
MVEPAADPVTGDPVPRPKARGTATWLVPVLLAMAASAVSQGFVRFTYAFVLPAMKDDLLGSYGAAGMLGAVNLGSYVLAVMLVTALASRIESTMLVKVGLAACGLGMLGLGLAPNVPVLVLGMAVIGGFSAAVWIPVSGVVAACAPPEKRGLAYGLMIMGIGLSIALSGVLTDLVQQAGGASAWREVWLIEGSLALVILVFVVFGLKPVGTAHTGERIRGTSHLRGHVAIKRIYVSYGVYGVGFSIYVHYLIAALHDTGGMTFAEANRAYSLLGIASIFGAILLGRISDHLNRGRTLATAMTITGLSALVVTVTHHTLLLTLSVVCFGLVMTGIGVVLAAYLSDVLDPRDVATVFGGATVALAVAQFVAPPAAGWLTDATGSFIATYLVAGTAGVVSGLVAWSLPPRRDPSPTSAG